MSEATRPPWMAIAEAERGQREIPGPRDNPRIVEYLRGTTYPPSAIKDEVAWCSAFVDWVMKRAGFPGTSSAAAASWAQARGYRRLLTPRRGCITVIRRKAGPGGSTGTTSGNHVAFFVSQTSTHITLFGGNQSDMVRESTYALAAYDVLGYFWPAKGI